MYSLHIKKRLSDLLALSALLLFIGLEVIGCKDMEDCRSLYNSNFVVIEFKGTHALAMDHVDVERPAGSKENLENSLGDKLKQEVKDNLKNLQGKRLPLLLLHPKDKQVTLLIYTTPTDPHPHTITLHYQVKHSLLSPNCGIQSVYMIERVETSFESSTIVAPEGKITNRSIAGNDKPHVEISY